MVEWENYFIAETFHHIFLKYIRRNIEMFFNNPKQKKQSNKNHRMVHSS